MQIGHKGHTRPLERIVSVVLLIVAARVAAPVPSVVYTNELAKLLFAALLAWPAVWLLAARGLQGRKRALLGVLVTYVYTGLLGFVVDPSRFASVGAWFGLAAITGYLYFVTAWEIKWEQSGSSRSSPLSPQ